MKVLITGATGFIGSHLADLLYMKGNEIRCTIRKTSSLKWLTGKPYELIETSLSDVESLKQIVKDVDYVYHVAGLTYGRNYDEFLRSNRDATASLLKAIIDSNADIKRFLFVSSQTAGGPSKSLEEPMTENMEPHPITSYGKSKLEAENEVNKVKDKLPVTIVRAPAVFGPRDTEIYKIFKTAKVGLGTLVGLKPKYLNLAYSGDLVSGFVQAAESEKSIGETYYITNEGHYSWDEMMDIIRDALGKNHLFKLKIPHSIVLATAGVSGFFGKFSKKPPVFNYEKGIDFIQNYWTCSIEKAKHQLGYKPGLSVPEAINYTIKWYKDNNWL